MRSGPLYNDEFESKEVLAEKLAIKLQRIQTDLITVGGAELRSLVKCFVVALRTCNIERLRKLNKEFEKWIGRNSVSVANLIDLATMLRLFVGAYGEDEDDDDDDDD